jgi:NAD+ diphosphatase
VFTPGVTTEATEGLLFLLARNQTLCVIRDGDDSVVLPRGAPSEDGLYLGELDGEPCFAQFLGDGALPPNCEAAPLRQLFGQLSDETFATAGRALAVTTWDRDHRYCGRCGAETVRSTKERTRLCIRCESPAYPRLSPAMIVLVEREGTCLLARNARTKMPFYSTLAGFVEVGESLEGCVHREVREEAGIEVTDVRYFGSQPWPFTNSLMIGFTARWASGELRADEEEILDARWFQPTELPVIPPKLSIAHELIMDFVKRATTSAS